MNKKLILSIGTLGAVVAPVAAVVACGSSDDEDQTVAAKNGHITLSDSGKHLIEITTDGNFETKIPVGKAKSKKDILELFKGVGTLSVDKNVTATKVGDELQITVTDAGGAAGKDKDGKEVTAKAEVKILTVHVVSLEDFNIYHANKEIAAAFAKAIQQAKPFDFTNGAYMPVPDSTRQSFNGISSASEIHPVLTLSREAGGIVATYTDAFLKQNAATADQQVVYHNKQDFINVNTGFGHMGDKTKTAPGDGSWLTFWNFVDVSEVITLVNNFLS